jgi:hypothetical protein
MAWVVGSSMISRPCWRGWLSDQRPFPSVRGQTRRAVLKRFPYAVYYRQTNDQIVVLAVHGRQDPKRWQSRQ